MLDVLSASMRGSSLKRRLGTPVYVVADVALSPQELNSARCTSLANPLFDGNEQCYFAGGVREIGLPPRRAWIFVFGWLHEDNE